MAHSTAAEAATSIWTIGSPDGRSPDLRDNYGDPAGMGEVTWRPGRAGQRWPLFHASPADPEGGYRPFVHSVVFDLDRVGGDFSLRLDYLAIAPRLASLIVRVNGSEGRVYLRPHPSTSKEIRLHSGLHTPIYVEGRLDLSLPGSLFRAGENRIAFQAEDQGEVLREERPDAVKRLDRMANGAGFIYQYLELSRATGSTGAVLEAAELVPTVVYRRDANGRLVEQCDLYLELGQPLGQADLTLEVAGERRALPSASAAFGHLRFPLDVPDGEGEIAYSLSGTVDGEAVALRGSVPRRRKWRVFVAPHAHTDIGYTHRQWEVAERLCRDIDDALDFIAAGPPEGYAYHLDCAWPLETYWATRGPERRRRFIEAVQAGRIGIAGIYADLLTHTAGLEDLIRSGELARELEEPTAVRSDFATVVDVASLSGSFPAVLEGTGVRYLVHADNQDRGPFRLNGGLHHLSPLWWEGTGGGRVLYWLAKMYCELRKVCGSPPVPSSAERGLQLWLEEWERPNYLPDCVLMYGQEADNTDIDPQPARFLSEWNANYEYPKLIPCEPGAFFREVEALWGDALPVVRGDGGAFWEDGAGSSFAETALTRQAQADLPAAERLETLHGLHNQHARVPTEQYREAWRQTLLYDEHTWGAHMSATDPDALLTRDQWAVKEGFAREAHAWGVRLLHVAAARHGLEWHAPTREVVVHNPHSWPLAGPVTVEYARGEVPLDPRTGTRLAERVLRLSPTQVTAELTLPEPLPGHSYRRFPLAPRGGNIEAPSRENLDLASPVVLENDRYRVTLDPERGCATSLMDKASGREMVDTSDQFGLGQFVHAAGGEGTRLVSNQADLPDGNPRLNALFRATAAERESFASGGTVRMTGAVEGGDLTVEWTLRDGAPDVEIAYRYEKAERTAKEAVYVAFPFALPRARVRSDAQLGWVDWERDTLPGACQEWLPLQTGILLDTPDAAAHIASPDAPLFCIGDVVRGNWPVDLDLSGGRVFSYVLNNYWHTNYKGTQGGDLRWRYRLRTAERIGEAGAFRAGWEARRPAYAHRLSFQDFRQPREPYADPLGGTLAEVWSEDDAIVLQSLRPAPQGDGYLARFQDTGGRGGAATLTIPGRPVTGAWLTDLLGNGDAPAQAEDGSLRVQVPPFGLATVRFRT